MNNLPYLYPRKDDFFTTYAKFAPISLFLIRAKECELFAQYTYERPILDIGSGEGIFAKILFDGQIDVGIDPNEKKLQEAKKLKTYRNVYCGVAEELPFNSSYFRTIISNCVLEHVEDIDRTFSEIHRVLVPGGKAYLTVITPSFSEAMSFDDIIFNNLGFKAGFCKGFLDYLFSHKYTLSLNEWKEKINKSGLKILEIRPYLSSDLLHIMGLFLISSTTHFIWKRIFNRHGLCSYIAKPKILMNLIRKYYAKDSKKHGCLFFVVSKEDITAVPLRK